MENFLNDCENKGLIKFPNPGISHKLISSLYRRASSESSARKARTSIANYYNNLSKEEKEKFIPEYDWKHYIISNFICSVKYNSEELKSYLQAIIEPKKISPIGTEL